MAGHLRHGTLQATKKCLGTTARGSASAASCAWQLGRLVPKNGREGPNMPAPPWQLVASPGAQNASCTSGSRGTKRIGLEVWSVVPGPRHSLEEGDEDGGSVLRPTSSRFALGHGALRSRFTIRLWLRRWDGSMRVGSLGSALLGLLQNSQRLRIYSIQQNQSIAISSHLQSCATGVQTPAWDTGLARCHRLSIGCELI